MYLQTILSFISLASLLILRISADESTPELLSTAGLWQRYRAELFEFLRAGDETALPGLQLVTTPFPAEWDENPEILQNIVTRMPVWKGSWELTDRDFRIAYEDFLTNIDLPRQPQKDFSRLEKIEDELFELEMKMAIQMQGCLQKYQQHQVLYSKYLDAGKPKTYEQYKQVFCASLSRAEQAIVDKRGELLIAQVEMRDEFYDARAALGKFAVTPESERTFTAYGSLKRFAESAQNGATNGFEVKLSSKSKTETRSVTTQSMSIGFDGSAFFSVPVSAKLEMGKEEMKFKTSTSDFQLLFGAKGYMVIPVFPSRTWYSPEVVKKYAKGPFRTQKTYFFDVAKKSFPQSAIMPLVVRNLFVVVGPKVEMYVSKFDAEEIEKKKNFGLSFSVAGVSFDFKKGSEFKRSDETDKLSKITIMGDSNTPQLMAIESQILPNM